MSTPSLPDGFKLRRPDQPAVDPGGSPPPGLSPPAGFRLRRPTVPGAGQGSAPAGGGSGVTPPAGFSLRRPTITRPEPPAPEGRTWGQAAKDTGIGIVQGAANLGGAIAQVPNLLTGGALDRYVVRPAQSALDRALGGPGESRGLAGGIGVINETLDAAKSPALQADQQELAETEGALAAAGKVLTRPRLLGQFLAEQVPMLGTLGVGAAGSAAKAGQAVLRREGTQEAAQQAGMQSAKRNLIGANTALSGGFAGQEAQQEAMALPDEVWDQNPAFVELAARVGRDEAKQQLALRAGQTAGAIAAPIGGAASLLAAPFEARVFTGALAGTGARGLAGAVAKEAGEEMIQEGGEQFGVNVGLRQHADAQQDLFDGVPEAAAIGGTVGGVLGGGLYAGGRLANRRRNSRTENPVAEAASRAAEAAREAGLEPGPAPANEPSAPVSAVPPETLATAVNDFRQRVSGLDQATGRPTPSKTREMVAKRVAQDYPGLDHRSILDALDTVPAVPFPDAAPGSLADAANALPSRTAPPAAPIDGPLGADDPSLNPAGIESAPADTAPAQSTLPPGAQAAQEQLQASQRYVPPPPDVPWFDTETGEFNTPTDDQLRQEIHRRLDNARDGSGPRMPSGARAAQEFGVPQAHLDAVREQVRTERREARKTQRTQPDEPAAAPERPAQPPPDVAASRPDGADQAVPDASPRAPDPAPGPAEPAPGPAAPLAQPAAAADVAPAADPLAAVANEAATRPANALPETQTNPGAAAPMDGAPTVDGVQPSPAATPPPGQPSQTTAEIQAAPNGAAEDTRGPVFSLAEEAGSAENDTAAAAKAWREQGTASPWFKRWFGKSTAKRNGKPITVHHGTAAEFNVFSDKRSGEATGHMTAPLGHFFTENRSAAQRYAENAADGMPMYERVIDAHLKTENPATMTMAQFQAVETREQAVALRARLERDGHDGIHLPEVGQWIVFDSEQVKSTGNRGTFDGDNPDIRFSLSDNERVTTDESVVGKQGQRAADGDSRRSVDESTSLPLNDDGTVTVYHHTSASAAESIRRTGTLRSAGEPDVYVTTRAETDTGYGDTAVAIQVDPTRLQLDDEFPNGRRDFRLTVGRPGGSLRVQVAQPNDQTASESTDANDPAESDIRFRLTAPAEAPRASEAMQQRKFDRVSRAIRAAIAEWGPNMPNVHVVQRFDEVGQDLERRGQTRSAQALRDDPRNSRTRGVMIGNHVYIVTDNLAGSAAEAEALGLRVLAHESIGHYGIDNIIGEYLDGGWDTLTVDIKRWRENPNLHPSVRKIMQTVERNYAKGDGKPVGDREFAMEVVAHMAEEGIRNPITNRIVAAVRRFLRTILPNLRVTDGEVRAMLANAESWLRAPMPANTGAMQPAASMALSRGARSAFNDARTFAGAVAAFERNELPNDKPVRVTEGTPDVLAKLDVPDLPIEINPRELQKVLRGEAFGGKHDLGRQVLQQLVRQLHEPVAVFDAYDADGKFLPDSRVILTELRDPASDQPVMVALRMSQLSGRHVVNNIRSAHGRPEQTYRNWMGDRRLTYLDQSKTPAWLTTGGLQLPKVVQANSRGSGRTVLTDADVVKPFQRGDGRYSMAEPGTTEAGAAESDTAAGKVERTDSPQFRKWFGDSKVVDADGAPLVVYHGTGRDIDAHRGIVWGSATPELANEYAELRGDQGGAANVQPLYMRIEKPFDADKLKDNRDLTADGFAAAVVAQAPALDADAVAGFVRRIRAGARTEESGPSYSPHDFWQAPRDKFGADGAAAITELLRAAGFDGVSYTELGHKTFGALTPGQVKSATGNRGTFDGTDPDIRHSLNEPAAAIDRLQEVLEDVSPSAYQRMKAAIGDKWTDIKRPLLGALQLRHLIELATDGKKPLLPLLRGWADTVQQMGADRQALMNEAGPMADHYRDWAHGKGLFAAFRGQRPQAKAMARLMHDATQLGIDPAKDYEPLAIVDKVGRKIELTKKNVNERIRTINAQIRGRSGEDVSHLRDEIKYLRQLLPRERARKAAYPRLVARYQALAQGEPAWHVVRGQDGTVIGIHQTEAAAQKAAKEVQGATLDTAPAPHAIYQGVRDWYARHGQRTQQALEERIRDLTMPEDQKVQMLDMIRLRFEQSRVEGVYFPLFRTGDYWLSATIPGTDGKDEQVFSMFETRAEQRQAEKGLRRKGAKAVKVGIRDARSKAKDAPPASFAGDVVKLLQKNGVSEQTQDEVWQMFLRSLPEMSMRKHQIHRRNVAGFDDNALRAFSHAAFHGAHQLARLRYSHVLEDDLRRQTELLEKQKADGELSTDDSLAADRLLNEIQKRHDWIMSPKDAAWANRLTGFGFFMYLGLTPAAAMVNLTQGAQVTFPVLGAKYGFDKAGRVLSQATWQAIRTYGNLEKALTSDEERAALRAFHAAGWIEKTQTHSLAGLSEGDQLLQTPFYQKMMGVVGHLFQTAEVMNREAATMAAFRLARAAGESFDASVRYAGEIVNGTHFDYGSYNRPRIMQNNISKVLLQFRNFSVGMTWAFWRQMYQSFKGESPEVRRQARRTVTGMMGMTGLLAGTMGLPLINVIRYTAEAAQAVFGDDDEPWSFDTEFRAFIGEIFGTEAAQYILDGPTSQVTGANIASRVGLADLWWREPGRDMDARETYYHTLEQVAGPLGATFKNTLVGLERMAEGQYWRGMESILPKFAKDSMKALRFQDEGALSMRGDPIMEDITAAQALTQAIGFSPTALSRQYRENAALKNYEQHILDRRAAVLNGYAIAVRSGDQADLARAQRRLIEWNRKFPEIAIDNRGLRASLSSRARYSAQAEQGIVLNRRIADRVRAAAGQAPPEAAP